ncbi:MAG: discoidin domain-containing protein [Verrucomicrobiota bacterium]
MRSKPNRLPSRAPSVRRFGFKELLVLFSALPLLAQAQALPENLAPQALITASAEYSAHYQAKFVADGRIPLPGSKADVDQAWCVPGAAARNGATLTFTWTNPVQVAEVVYYGRTAWMASECWKDYQLSLDDQAQPAVQGQFQMGHGPQHIRLATPAQVRKLTLTFRNWHGGLNPGASEIQIFAQVVPEGVLPKFVKLDAESQPETPESVLVDSPELKDKFLSGGLGFQKLLVIQRHELNPTHVYTYHVEGFQPGGGLWVYAFDAKSVKAGKIWKRLVDSSEGQILDCDLSPDGREVVFSWRQKKSEGYHIFRMNVDGSKCRQLTDGPHHNYNACWLPDGGIAFLSTRTSRFAYCWISPVGVLHRMERDGSRVQQLSANIVNDFTPSVMEDGRLIYSRWEYVDKPAIPIQSLWTIRPDGTGLAGYYGNRVLSPATFMEARSIPGRSGEVLCVLTSHNGPCRGAIGMINPKLGNNTQAAIRNLTPEVKIGRVDQGSGNNIRGPYESPFPLDGQYYLVSKRGMLLVRDYEGTQTATLLSPKDGLGYYGARPIRSYRRPPVLDAQTDTNAGPWATVVLQDVYRGLEPFVQRGEVKEICVVEEMRKAVRTEVANRAFGFQFPVISCGATYAGKKVWGYAPVAPDGSACFQVPAGVPIYFLALDAQGRAVQRMRTFTHLMPGETQGCMGCHEPRQQTLAAQHPPVIPRKPDTLRPPDWGAGIGFDYSTVVQPVLDRNCTLCHSGSTPAGKVDLCGDKTDFFSVSYEYLARGRKKISEGEYDNPYVNWIPTYNGMEANILQIQPKFWGSHASKLTDVILSGHRDTNGQPRIELTAAEQRRIFAWIDLNVPYYGTSETAYPEKKGCRQLYPTDLDKTLAEVAKRRCVSCHAEGKIPRQVWVRIVQPQRNNFLTAPLARDAGGSERCGRPVFQNTDDPDYLAILRTFEAIQKQIEERPRMDMAGAQPAKVDRSCLGKVD